MNPPEKVWQRIQHASCTFFACNIAYGVSGILRGNRDLEEVIRRHPYLSKLIEKGMQTKHVSLRFRVRLL